MVCPDCGHEGSNYCSNCGNRLTSIIQKVEHDKHPYDKDLGEKRWIFDDCVKRGGHDFGYGEGGPIRRWFVDIFGEWGLDNCRDCGTENINDAIGS